MQIKLTNKETLGLYDIGIDTNKHTLMSILEEKTQKFKRTLVVACNNFDLIYEPNEK
jgi:hypothetical protein